MDRVELADGTVIEIRPLAEGDRATVEEAFRHLSPDSAYRRFLAPVPSLSEGQLTFLTNIDHDRHEALAASEAGTGEPIGISRYVITREDRPRTAEVAVTIIDGWQERGIGGVLLQRLAALARDRGIERFCALMFSDNVRMMRLMASVGPIVERWSEGATLELVAALDPAAIETEAGQVV